jgi:hypothetical protein
MVPPSRPSSARNPRRLTIIALVAGLIGYAAYDLFGPNDADLRKFDADAIGRSEVGMWRAYYGHRRAALFFEMAHLLRTQYRLPFLRSYLDAYYAVHAAYTFQKGAARADYERALPDLQRFYTSIQRSCRNTFDPETAARLELDWWIVHRMRRPASDLTSALADLQSEIYGLPAHQFTGHATLRAEAMLFRDAKSGAGGLSEADWEKISGMLRGSWSALFDAVNGGRSVRIESSTPIPND